MNKVDTESNLLQDIFDLAWNKYSNWYDRVFDIKYHKMDILNIFPALPYMLKYELPKRNPKEGIFIHIENNKVQNITNLDFLDNL